MKLARSEMSDEARRLRREGLTYDEIGERLGVARSTAWRWVGEGKPLVRKAFYIVDAETGCWVWQRLQTDGYGSMGIPGKRSAPAHRVHYERLHGPVPEGLVLDHLCRNRACVNPDHLEVVTQAENVRRGRGCKLNLEKAEQIRRASETMPQKEVAERFGVDAAMVSRIVHGKQWVADVAH